MHGHSYYEPREGWRLGTDLTAQNGEASQKGRAIVTVRRHGGGEDASVPRLRSMDPPVEYGFGRFVGFY